MIFCLLCSTPSAPERGFTQKEMNLLPWRADSYLLELIPFQKGTKTIWQSCFLESISVFQPLSC